jgi:hypothetical protein
MSYFGFLNDFIEESFAGDALSDGDPRRMEI